MGSTHLDPIHTSLYLLQLHADLAVPNVAGSGEGEGRWGRGGSAPLREAGKLAQRPQPQPRWRPSLSPASPGHGLSHSLSFSWLYADTDLAPDPGGRAPGPCTGSPKHTSTSAHDDGDSGHHPVPRHPRRCEGGALGEHSAHPSAAAVFLPHLCPGLFLRTEQPHCLHPALTQGVAGGDGGGKATFSGA